MWPEARYRAADHLFILEHETGSFWGIAHLPCDHSTMKKNTVGKRQIKSLWWENLRKVSETLRLPLICSASAFSLKKKWNHNHHMHHIVFMASLQCSQSETSRRLSQQKSCCYSFYKIVKTSIFISVLLLYTCRPKSLWICVDYNVFVCLVHPLPMFSYAMSLLFGGKTISRKTQRSKYIHIIIIISLCTLSSLWLLWKFTFEWSDLRQCEEQSPALEWWDRTTSRSRWTADLSIMMDLRKIAD